VLAGTDTHPCGTVGCPAPRPPDHPARPDPDL